MKLVLMLALALVLGFSSAVEASIESSLAAFASSPDGNYLIERLSHDSTKNYYTYQVTDLRSYQVKGRVQFKECGFVGWNAKNQILTFCSLSADSHYFRVFEPLSFKELKYYALPQKNKILFSVQSQDRKKFILEMTTDFKSKVVPFEKRQLYVLDLEQPARPQKLGAAHSHGFPLLSPDQNWIVYLRNPLMFFNVRSGKLTQQVKNPTKGSIYLPDDGFFSLDSRYLILPLFSGRRLEIWNVAEASTILNVELPIDDFYSSGFEVTYPNARGEVAITDEFRVWIYDLKKQQVVRSRLILRPGGFNTGIIQWMTWRGDKLLLRFRLGSKISYSEIDTLDWPNRPGELIKGQL